MKISILLKIFKWLAKFGGHILLYHLIIKLIGYRVLYYKLENGYYLGHIHIKKGYKVYPIRYKEGDEDMEFWEKDLEYFRFIKKIILAKRDENIIEIHKKENTRLRGWITD